MATIIVRRPTLLPALLRRCTVHVDGVEAGRLRARDYLSLAVPEGPRGIVLSMDGIYSNALACFVSGRAPATFEIDSWAKFAEITRRAAPEPLLQLRQVDAEATLRGFMQSMVERLRRQYGDNLEPVLLGDFRYSHGDWVTLRASAERRGLVFTRHGSWNHRLWTHMRSVGWMRDADLGPLTVAGICGFELTDYGRVEILDL